MKKRGVRTAALNGQKPFQVPCATCSDPITRVLRSDPATCQFCQRILGKRFDKAQEPKTPRQPKIKVGLTGRLRITQRIHDPNWQLSWCMMPVHEIQIQGSHYPDPCTMLMMKEDYEGERRFAVYQTRKSSQLQLMLPVSRYRGR